GTFDDLSTDRFHREARHQCGRRGLAGLVYIAGRGWPERDRPGYRAVGQRALRDWPRGVLPSEWRDHHRLAERFGLSRRFAHLVRGHLGREAGERWIGVPISDRGRWQRRRGTRR